MVSKKNLFISDGGSKFNQSNEIKSDFNLLLDLLKELFLYFIFLIPNLFLWIFNLIFNFKSDSSSKYFNNIFLEPFRIIVKISDWFFQAKYTSGLIIFLIVCYLLEFLFLVPNPNLFNSLMAHPYHIFEGNFYGLFTSLFLHADLSHILSNLLALLVFGRIVERQMGYLVLVLFASSGIIANLVSNLFVYFFQPNSVNFSLGASSGITGLIMFAILLEPLAISSIFIIPLPIFLIGWFLIMLDIIGLTNPSRVNHLAHLSGYSALLVLFFFLELKHRKKIILGFAINLAMLLFIYIFSKIFGFNILSSLI